ncbi:MAG: hypothetical protein NTZ85_15215 [Bacteroidia bacterium]|nr:hypothetical protein [Bacteroidia bacterium]
MEDSRMKNHVTVVGAIHIGFGIIGLFVALGVFFLINFAKGMVGDDEIPKTILGFISLSVPLLIGSLATLKLVGGIGLLSFQPWARYLIIVVAILAIPNIPIGTLRGVYSIWVLFQEETKKLFERKTA